MGRRHRLCRRCSACERSRPNGVRGCRCGQWSHGWNGSTTVLPFILRGVNLYGIDSVQTPSNAGTRCGNIASDLKPAGLDTIGHDIGLDELDDVLTGILDGKAVGRGCRPETELK